VLFVCVNTRCKLSLKSNKEITFFASESLALILPFLYPFRTFISFHFSRIPFSFSSFASPVSNLSPFVPLLYFLSLPHSLQNIMFRRRTPSNMMTPFLYIALCSLVKGNRRFRCEYCLHHQAARMIEAVRISQTSLPVLILSQLNLLYTTV
jgi:hypothetical protein